MYVGSLDHWCRGHFRREIESGAPGVDQARITLSIDYRNRRSGDQRHRPSRVGTANRLTQWRFQRHCVLCTGHPVDPAMLLFLL